MFDEQCLIDIAVYIGKLKVNIWSLKIVYILQLY
jgi:hypothetical protein